jgi:hypothetical protein
MDREYEIFEKSLDGSAQRRGVVADLEEAIAKANALAKLSPNEFYILSTDTREIVHRSQGTEPAPPITGAEPETA